MEGDDPSTAGSPPWRIEPVAVLLALEDRLRLAAGPSAVQQEAVNLLGDVLVAEEVRWLEADEAMGGLRLAAARPGDAGGDPVLPEARILRLRAPSVEPVGEGAARNGMSRLAAPVLVGGHLVAAVLLDRALAWTEAEIALVESAAARTWAALERARAEARLQDSEAQARAQADEVAVVYATAPIGLCVLDREGRYVRINDVLAASNGLPVEAHLGRPMREVLPELAAVVEPLLARVLVGEELRGVEITGITPLRPGVPRVWRENFVPLRDAGGRIVGVTVAVEEVTEEKAAERRRGYLLRLEDRLRGTTGPREALDAAAEELGRELGATLAGLSRLEDDGEYVHIESEWRAGATPSTLGRHRIADYGEARLATLRSGGAVVIPDVGRDPLVGDPARYAAFGVQAAIEVPLLRGGRLRGHVFACLDRSHAWTDEEVALARETAERAWEAAERASAEAAMREGEARFRQLAESIPEVFYIVELDDRRMSYVSPAFEQVWGRSVAEVYADSRAFLQAVHPADRGRVEADTARLRTGEPVASEYRILRPDGSVRHIFDRAALVSDPLTGRRRAIGLAADITERRRVEERLQLATEAAGIGIFDADLVTGASEWDLRQRAIWGVGRDEVVTDDAFTQGIHPEDRPIMRAAVARALDPAGDRLYQAEYRLRPHDGERPRWIAATGRVHFEDGRAVRLIGTVQDITARKAAEAAVSESEARFRTLANTLPALIFVATGDSGNTWVNEPYVVYSGRPAERLLGRGWIDTVHPEDIATAMSGAQQSWRRGELYVSETRFLRADGAWRWHLVRGNPIRDATGQVVQWVGAATDIQEIVEAREALAISRGAVERANAELEARVADRTASLAEANRRLAAEIERREAVQAALMQAQKLEAVGQLTSGIAHDFNNVIAAIAGGFSVIERRTDDPRLLEVARHGAKAAERGGTLVRQLLAFARQQVLEPRPCDLPALLREAEPLVARSLGPRVELRVDCPDGLGEVSIDPVQLEAALINLAVNARDAMDGGGTLTISARPCEPCERERPPELGVRPAVMLVISDTGAGMAPEVLTRVIEPFFTTKAPGRGTGLGLAMVHGFVHQSKGALRIDSREGEGTTVTLYLPRPGEPTPSEPDPQPGSPDGIAAANGTVLLVDDDAAVRGVTAAQLSDLGYEVLEAGDAGEAIRSLESRGDVDAVLSDVAMPGTDGVTLAAELRRRRPGLPVLFMTGHADRDRLRGEAVLDKPFTLHALAAALAERIAASRAG